MLDHVQVNN